LLPVGRRSSNGSIVGAALTYRSPDLQSTRRRSLSKRLKPCARYGRCAAAISFTGRRFGRRLTTAVRLGCRIRHRGASLDPGQSTDAMSALLIGRDHVTLAGIDNLHFVGRQISDSSSKSNTPSGPKPWNMETSRIAPRSESRADAIARCRVERYTGDIGAVELIPIGACWLTSERC
jgi:hypothetical protein